MPIYPPVNSAVTIRSAVGIIFTGRVTGNDRHGTTREPLIQIEGGGRYFLHRIQSVDADSVQNL